MQILPGIRSAFVCTILLWSVDLHAGWTWVEGELPVKTNIGRHPWYYGQVKRELLSGNNFLAHFDKERVGTAEYTFDVAQPGEYTFWLRANPVQASLKYSLNGASLVPVEFDARQVDRVNIAGNGAPDLRFLSWCEVGKVTLRGGSNEIKFITDSENSHHGAIDCFVFINESFTPDGVTKPDEVSIQERRISTENQGWVIWNPGADDFKKSPIDLRYLNESVAGEKGRIQARGERFVHETSGQAVRFWGVNGPPSDLRDERLRGCARMLAKYGVNLVRIHAAVFDEKTGELRQGQIARRLEVVQAMKAEGIYSHLSIYFPLWLRPDAGAGWREGYTGEKPAFALIYFEPELQKMYRKWWENLLTTKGPKGASLLEEPAVMGIELVNEDSLFFWTFNYDKIPAPQMQKLERLFAEWCKRKYGTLEKTLEKWNRIRHARDDIHEGRLGFRPLYDMFTHKTPRDQDTAEFLLHVQTQFYEDTIKYLRGLGYKGMITTSNWITASSDVFGPLEKYSYGSGDFIDRHGYFSCNHKGNEAAWSIRNGHTYSNVSALRFENEEPSKPKRFAHPAMDPMYNYKPSMNSETTWNRPNRYRSEAPLFLSCYGALQGSDAIVHFALDSDNWSPKPNFFMQPWTLMAPSQMGQFPAAALIYRTGLIRTGDLMADLSISLPDAIALKGSKLAQQTNLDELRKADLAGSAPESAATGVDPLIHFVGRTNVSIGSAQGESEIKDLSSFLDRTSSTVTGSTGELKLDYDTGLLTLNAPMAQGASGNLESGGVIDLPDIRVRSNLDLAHIVVVALDRTPLASSSRMLVQVMTEEKPAGFTTEEVSDGVFRITKIGGSPWLIKAVQGSIDFKRSDAASLAVTPLDFNGYPAGPPVRGSPVQLQPDKIYYLVETLE